jgi:glutamyl-tRNA reductase
VIDRLVLLGVSHHTAPVALRERLNTLGHDAKNTLLALKAHPGVAEGMVLSTCNRVEIYGAGQPPGMVAQAFHQLLDRPEISGHLYERHGEDALRHLFRVASSLDSMVVGEPQILGQLKEAFTVAHEAGATGDALSRAVGRAFAVAKRVRTETEVGRSAVSMSHVAVDLCRKVFDTLEGKRALLVGAGQMATLAAQHLLAQRITHVTIVNRSPENAAALAHKLDPTRARVDVDGLDKLVELLPSADIVLVAMGGDQLVLDRAMVRSVAKRRRFRPLFLVDLSVPRAIDPEVRRLENVYLKDVDDIGAIVAANSAQRAAEAVRAEAIVEDEVEQFVRISRGREAFPVLAELRRRADAVARAEMARTLGLIGSSLDERQQRSVEAMAQAIVNKLLHEPTVRLREAAESGGASSLAQVAAELFGLPNGSPPTEGRSEPVEGLPGPGLDDEDGSP